ncbi:MAG: hypothetical protein LAP40_27790 [Acidobacteriia bacterium]|nr:hypothetical protein [Terriglobia bacterium]
MTQMTTPLGGVLQWQHRTFTYSGGIHNRIYATTAGPAANSAIRLQSGATVTTLRVRGNRVANFANGIYTHGVILNDGMVDLNDLAGDTIPYTQ